MTETREMDRLWKELEAIRKTQDETNTALTETAKTLAVVTERLETAERSRGYQKEALERLSKQQETLLAELKKLPTLEERMKGVEQGVEDYQSTKLRVLGALAVLGVGSGSIGAALQRWWGS